MKKKMYKLFIQNNWSVVLNINTKLWNDWELEHSYLVVYFDSFYVNGIVYWISGSVNSASYCD